MGIYISKFLRALPGHLGVSASTAYNALDTKPDKILSRGELQAYISSNRSLLKNWYDESKPGSVSFIAKVESELRSFRGIRIDALFPRKAVDKTEQQAPVDAPDPHAASDERERKQMIDRMRRYDFSVVSEEELIFELKPGNRSPAPTSVRKLKLRPPGQVSPKANIPVVCLIPGVNAPPDNCIFYTYLRDAIWVEEGP